MVGHAIAARAASANQKTAEGATDLTQVITGCGVASPKGCLEFTQSCRKPASFLDEAEHRQQRPGHPWWDRGSFPPYRWLLDPASRSAGDNFYSNWAIQCF